MAGDNPIRLFIDDDVWLGLAAALRERGFDAVHVYEVAQGSLSDNPRSGPSQSKDKDTGRLERAACQVFHCRPEEIHCEGCRGPLNHHWSPKCQFLTR